MAGQFSVFQMRNETDWQRLVRFLLKNGTPAVSANLRPAKEIFNFLRLRGCLSVVVEETYLDEDHRRCHARLHNLAQSAMSRYCRRLHFFSKEVQLSDLRDLPKTRRNQYMGMCVWRPINAFPVGRTILSAKNVDVPVGRNWKPYITCSTEYQVSMAGNTLIINGSPFIQQDHMVAACATAAIWMANWYMSTQYDEFTTYYSPQITEAATRYDLSFGRAIPSEGLHNGQILEAFRALGYDPIAYDLLKTSATVSTRLLYRLVESGIPVVAGLVEPEGGHAITVFGHALDLDIHPPIHTFPERARPTGALKYIDSSDYSQAFLVNDDATGPYRWMELKDTNEMTEERLRHIYQNRRSLNAAKNFLGELAQKDITTIAIFSNNSGQPEFIAGIDFLAAPLPTAITLPPKDAQDKALAVFHTLMAGDLGDFPTLGVRTYLTESNAFKEHIGKETNPKSDFSWWLRSFYYPKWIWVTEFSVYQNNSNPIGREVVASIVIDSSAPRDSLDFVLAHIGGWVIPISKDQQNVIQVIKDIARNRLPFLYDNNFAPYVQLERKN